MDALYNRELHFRNMFLITAKSAQQLKQKLQQVIDKPIEIQGASILHLINRLRSGLFGITMAYLRFKYIRTEQTFEKW